MEIKGVWICLFQLMIALTLVYLEDNWLPAKHKISRIGVVICNGIDNTVKDEEKYKVALLDAEKEALKHLKNEEFSSNEVIKVWREAFQKFKTKRCKGIC